MKMGVSEKEETGTGVTDPVLVKAGSSRRVEVPNRSSPSKAVNWTNYDLIAWSRILGSTQSVSESASQQDPPLISVCIEVRRSLRGPHFLVQSQQVTYLWLCRWFIEQTELLAHSLSRPIDLCLGEFLFSVCIFGECLRVLTAEMKHPDQKQPEDEFISSDSLYIPEARAGTQARQDLEAGTGTEAVRDVAYWLSPMVCSA